LKLDVEEVAAGILERSKGETIDWQQSVADPSMWKEDGGPSLIERMVSYRPDKWRPGDPTINFAPADNTRITGWQQMRARLGGDEPMLFICANCLDWLRTVPVLQHDARKPEDVDTDAEDHAGDDTRYACMARPMSRVAKKKDTGPAPWTLAWVIQQDELAKQRERMVRR
jgi:hypothetical protein